MYRIFVLILCLMLFPALTVRAEGEKADEPVEKSEKSDDAKMVSGMSIVGNDEAPKALYIVPWKSSEIGAETNLSMMLTENAMPVDRDVFMRQLDFFEVSTAYTKKEH
ncbi:MAG: hypothetical protein IBX46_04895 [Desulfuromonadales bacterium]|nr:hypothetical protein [Desulfuromonadales bacterium]